MPALFAKPAPGTDSSVPDVPNDGRDDFFPLFGRWAVSHRRLRRRLAGDTLWDEFAGYSEMRPLIGGLGTIDDNILELPSGTYRAATLRLFDTESKLWSIWWFDGRSLHMDEAPLRGRFEDGIGTFFADDVWEGTPIRVRFIWSEITGRSARWEQAFSTDGGREWETNWIMRFERTGD
ncbi:DUF1579 domain-containing protein [Inquilinus sp.]|uniref:DUF1579 domain-containing protein n=1 Tax=Inquilinus sp. TaxID=1932117 RepID=UPI0031D18377